MKIKTKILWVLSTLPILLLVLIGTGWYQISQLNQMSDTVKSNYNLSIIASQIQADVKDSGIMLRNIVMYSNQSEVKEEIKKLESKSEHIANNILQLESLASSPERKVLIEELHQVNNEFLEYRDRVIESVTDFKRAEATRLIENNSDMVQAKITELTTEIVALFNNELGSSLSIMADDFQSSTIRNVIFLSFAFLFIIVLLSRTVLPISTRLMLMSKLMSDISNGKTGLKTKVEVISEDEIDQVAISFNRMTSSLVEQRKKEQDLTWIKTNIADITTGLSGTHELHSLGKIFLSKVVPLVESCHGVFYVRDIDSEENSEFKLISSYAFKERKVMSNRVQVGEGLIGQAIVEKSPIILTDVPADYVQITSGLGKAAPLNLYILPILFENEVSAVLEIASFKSFNETQQTFLDELIKDVGIILESVIGRIQLAKLLEETQFLMEEVQAQSEELQNQQEELKATNEELEEQTQALRNSEEKLQMQQEELEQTNSELEEKARVLEEQNFIFERTNQEVESARRELEIKAEQLARSSKYKSEFLANMSHELRTPLNSLIILSKLLTENAEHNLTPKQVEYARIIHSSGNDLLMLINDILDLAKIESGKMQVYPNKVIIEEIISNVDQNFRPLFNNKGIEWHIDVAKDVPTFIISDEVRILQILKNLVSNAYKFTEKGSVTLKVRPSHGEKHLNGVVFSVVDTGIGISKEHQDLIFEAFQQADGTTSRKFGGTGLGLSICKELTSLLEGEIAVESTEGKGSTFTFVVGNYEQSSFSLGQEEAAASIEMPVEIKKEVKEVKAIKQKGDHQGLTHYIKRLLIVDDDKNQRNALMELIGDMDFIIKAVSTGHEAIEEMKVNHFDCIILDLGLSDTTGFDLLERIREIGLSKSMKIIIYTGRELTMQEEMKLNKYTDTIILKKEHSPQRLKEELELFLSSFGQENRNVANDQNTVVNSELKGKKVLLVDDDVRNLFAISSVLELQGIEVIFAVNGLEAINTIKEQSDIDLVLMDIMMPEMDGYEAIQLIREQQKSNKLPIIALTAKAMKGDRAKCIEIGASDYIVKPIEPDQLVSLIKVWLH